jgi:hypothetical protein
LEPKDLNYIQAFLPEDLECIDPEFVNEFQEIISLPRGGGYLLALEVPAFGIYDSYNPSA